MNRHLSNATFGYHGRYLRVDVGSGRAEKVPLDAAVLRRFLGGSGLGTYLLLREALATTDPLSPAACLALVFSPLAGTPLTTTAKFAVVSKGPLTDRLNDSLAGGQFALAGKRTGCDAILLTGRASEPSVLVVDDDRVWLEPAGTLWGATCGAAQQQLRARLGSGYQVAVIGPAGERQVRFASLAHGRRHAGRGGNGAVLGSKNLKAVAVRGSRTCRWADPRGLSDLGRQLAERAAGPATAGYRELGTVANLPLLNRLGVLPTRNFQQGRFEQAGNLGPENLVPARTSPRRKTCAACAIDCEFTYAARGTDTKPAVQRLEYENVFAVGPLCGIGDPEVVLAAARQCDELGLDAISAGGTIAFAMECAERGLISADWLRFGDGPALLRALDLIAQREGLGDLMAEGSRRMARAVDGGSLAYAPQVKGMELPGYEPRGLHATALGLAVASRGADHNRSNAHDVDFSAQVDRRNGGAEAAALAVEAEDRAAVMDSLILCKFLRHALGDFYAEAAEMLSLATGWDVSPAELRTTARRIVTARKHFNILAGWQPEEDTLPDRFLDHPLPNDRGAVLSRERLQTMIRAYNLSRGWSGAGWVPAEQLTELGLIGVDATACLV